MEIKIDRPPNYQEIATAFPFVRSKVGVIYTYGNILYNPDFIQITNSLMEHEMVHSGRQEAWGIDQWWKDYIRNEFFRLNEEVMAHVREYETVLREGLGRKHRRAMLKIISDRLASPMYGNMMSKKEAKKLLKRKSK